MKLWASMLVLRRYRWLLWQLILRDLKIKYRRSVLGYLWSVLNPLMMMAILTVVFSTMFRFDIPDYPVYLLTGQLVYTSYAESTGAAMGSILGNAGLIKKVCLPKYIFPLSRVLSCFTTTLFSMLALFIVMAATGTGFHATLLLLPIALFYLLVFSIGAGVLLSVLMVFFRDMQHLYGVFLTALNYLTPIFYPAMLLPPGLRRFLAFNPLHDMILVFRKAVLYGQWPSLWEHAICAGFAFGTLALGLYVFKRHQDRLMLYI